jgi:drug/metabolite transporter (DMT)-like permease
MNPLLVNGLRATMSLVFILPMMLLTGGLSDYALLTAPRVAFLVGSVLIGGVLGDFMYLTSLRTLGVGRAFPITSSHPVFTVLFSALFLGATVGGRMVAGMVLVIFGVYLVARPRGHVEDQDGLRLTPRQIAVGVGLALLAAITWSLATITLTMGLEGGINTLTVNSVRVPFVAGFSLAAAAGRGGLSSIRQMDRRTLRLLFLAGLLGWGLGGTLFTLAIQLTGPSVTAIISSTAPLFAVPLSYFFLKERPTRYTLAGTVVCIIGVALVLI